MNNWHEPMQPYVLMLGIGFDDGKKPTAMLHELYRGKSSDCLKFMSRVTTPSHDCRSISNWWMQCGRLDERGSS